MLFARKRSSVISKTEAEFLMFANMLNCGIFFSKSIFESKYAEHTLGKTD